MTPAYRPMLATLIDKPFDDKGWVFETKWDGFRLITEKHGHALRLWSRNGIAASNSCAAVNPPWSPPHHRCTSDRDFVPWRFSVAGRISASARQ